VIRCQKLYPHSELPFTSDIRDLFDLKVPLESSLDSNKMAIFYNHHIKKNVSSREKKDYSDVRKKLTSVTNQHLTKAKQYTQVGYTIEKANMYRVYLYNVAKNLFNLIFFITIIFIIFCLIFYCYYGVRH